MTDPSGKVQTASANKTWHRREEEQRADTPSPGKLGNPPLEFASLSIHLLHRQPRFCPRTRGRTAGRHDKTSPGKLGNPPLEFASLSHTSAVHSEIQAPFAACRGTQAATGAACKAAGFASGGFSLNPLIMVGVPLFGGVFPRSGAGLTLPESGLVPLR